MLSIYFLAEHLSNGNPERGVVHESGLRLERNSMWQVPHFEVGQDTPPDELHVVMLGIALHLFAAPVYKISHFLLDFEKTLQNGDIRPLFSKAHVQRCVQDKVFY